MCKYNHSIQRVCQSIHAATGKQWLANTQYAGYSIITTKRSTCCNCFSSHSNSLFNDCRVQQVPLEYLHYQKYYYDKYELQYHQSWSVAVVYRTREPSSRVGSSAHSREETHTLHHPRGGHCRVRERYVHEQGSHSHKTSHFQQRREHVLGHSTG